MRSQTPIPVMKTKFCHKCSERKPLDEFSRNKSRRDGLCTECRDCCNEYAKEYRQGHRKKLIERSKKYTQEHPEETAEYQKKYHQEHKEEARQRIGRKSMYENKSCSQYLGVVIAERLCRHLFKDVEVMPNNHSGYDIICNKGKRIDVKAACVTFTEKNKKYSRWAFRIKKNTIADFFILVAFDNRTDLNPLHLWMIPGNELNQKENRTITHSTIHKWDKWKKDIEDAKLCCAEMKTDGK